MSERTIREIIGWKNPDVDDLLSWLNEHLFHVWLEIYGDPASLPEARDVYVNYKRVVSYGDERDEWFNACAPSLLGALEKIVRQVACTESNGTQEPRSGSEDSRRAETPESNHSKR